MFVLQPLTRLIGLVGFAGAVLAQQAAISTPTPPSSPSPEPGYFTNFSTVTGKEADSLSFGKRFAVLNLDLTNAIVGGVNSTANGRAFIASVAKWVDAVHAKQKQSGSEIPLQVFSRVYFYRYHPEVGPSTPFAKTVGALVNATESDPRTALYPPFNRTSDRDVVLQKTRYYAGTGNELEEILRAQGIDTVILSGLRTSGVILSTVYRLFDLDYNIYVIGNNTIEAGDSGGQIDQTIKQLIIPKLPANVITVEQAIAALKRSG